MDLQLLEGEVVLRLSQLHLVALAYLLHMRFFMPWGTGMNTLAQADRDNYVRINWKNVKPGNDHTCMYMQLVTYHTLLIYIYYVMNLYETDKPTIVHTLML